MMNVFERYFSFYSVELFRGFEDVSIVANLDVEMFGFKICFWLFYISQLYFIYKSTYLFYFIFVFYFSN